MPRNVEHTVYRKLYVKHNVARKSCPGTRAKTAGLIPLDFSRALSSGLIQSHSVMFLCTLFDSEPIWLPRDGLFHRQTQRNPNRLALKKAENSFRPTTTRTEKKYKIAPGFYRKKRNPENDLFFKGPPKVVCNTIFFFLGNAHSWLVFPVLRLVLCHGHYWTFLIHWGTPFPRVTRLFCWDNLKARNSIHQSSIPLFFQQLQGSNSENAFSRNCVASLLLILTKMRRKWKKAAILPRGEARSRFLKNLSF